MTLILSVMALLVIAGVVLFMVLGVMSRSGSAPGLVHGRLAPCPASPNCVCSEYKEDAAHYIDPVMLANHETSMPLIKSVIETAGGKVIGATDNYLAATFSSAVFGFVDDVEVRLDAQRHVLQLRSASRVGHGDLGVNRKRAAFLKQHIAEKLDAAIAPDANAP